MFEIPGPQGRKPPGKSRRNAERRPKVIAENVSIPVIASGGAGNCEHFYDALTAGKADAALAV